MSNDVNIQELLDSLPTGDELHDPREGEHEPVLSDVNVVENSEKASVPFAIELTFTGFKDVEGREFQFNDRVNVPEPDSSNVIKSMFLASLHNLGIIEFSDKRGRAAADKSQVDLYAKLFASRVGSKVPMRLYIDKSGWLRARVQRPR